MIDEESGKSGDYEDEREEEQERRQDEANEEEEESCSAFRPEQYEVTIRSLEDQVSEVHP